jgi:phage shock protein PspC (stress-responsive transcriptional regulator)
MEQETTTSEATAPPPPPAASPELTRSATDRILGGVASGIARRLALPVWLVRALFILFSLGGGLGVALYVVGWVFIRAEDESDTIAERFFDRTTSTGSWVGIALIFVALIVLLDNISFLRGGVIWAVALLAVGFLLYTGDLPRLIGRDEDTESKEGVQPMTTTKTPVPDTSEDTNGVDMGSTPPPPPSTPAPTPPIRPPAPPREKSILGRLTFGVMAIALGVLALLDNTTTLVDPATRHYLALAMTILGIGLLVGAFAGRARWLALVGLLGLPILFGSPALEYDFDDWNAATVSQTPTTFADLDGIYEHSIGELVIDLRELPWDGELVELDASLGIGELRILLPETISIIGHAEASIGHVEFDNRQSSGLSPNLPFDVTGTEGTLELSASLGIGEIDIDRYPAESR